MKKNLWLTKKDGDIAALKNFLPERKFNETVIKIMRCAVRGEVARIPMDFEILPLEKDVLTKIDFPQELIDQIREKFGRGPLTTQIKRQIKRCIRANLKTVPIKRLTTLQTKKIYAQTQEFAHRSKELPDGSEKYRRMLKDYRGALGALIADMEKEMGRENEK